MVVVVVVVVMTVVGLLDNLLCRLTNQQQHLDQQVPILHEVVGSVSDCDLECLVRALAVVLEEQQEPILQLSRDCASDCGPEEA